MELRDRRAVATFFATEPLVAGKSTTLGEDEAHHARVRRVSVGERLRLVDGAGAVALGRIVRLGKAQVLVDVDQVEHVDPLPSIHMVVPVADRERMLWLAEKVAELGACSWRPLIWRRSRHVTPRGEGVAFQAKVRARMVGALTQSGSAWLPALYPDATLDRAIASCASGAKWLLDLDGAPLPTLPVSAPVTIAVGPEGGLEPAERAELVASGFTPVRIAPLTLRFETAAVAALAYARGALMSAKEPAHV